STSVSTPSGAPGGMTTVATGVAPGDGRAPAGGATGTCERTSMSTSTSAPAAGTITMYSTTWCGYCNRLKKQLDGVGIAYNEVNIEEDPAAADFVQEVNGGNQTVPTVLFPDGSAATNPSLADVKARLGV